MNPGTDVQYEQLDDDSWPDATIYFYHAGRNHKVLGAQANVSVAGFHLIELRCEAYFVDRDREGRGYSVNVVLSAMLETA